MRKPRIYIRVLCVFQESENRYLLFFVFVIDLNNINIVEFELT